MFARALLPSSLLVSLFTLVMGFQYPLAAEQNPTRPFATPAVSIIRLVADCDKFDGQSVLTTGYGSFDFENHTVCVSAELGRVDPQNCLWLKADDEGIALKQLRALKRWSGRWIKVEAKVSCSDSLYAGTLEAIQFIVECDKGRVLWTTDPAVRAAIERQ